VPSVPATLYVPALSLRQPTYPPDSSAVQQLRPPPSCFWLACYLLDLGLGWGEVRTARSTVSEVASPIHLRPACCVHLRPVPHPHTTQHIQAHSGFFITAFRSSTLPPSFLPSPSHLITSHHLSFRLPVPSLPFCLRYHHPQPSKRHFFLLELAPPHSLRHCHSPPSPPLTNGYSPPTPPPPVLQAEAFHQITSFKRLSASNSIHSVSCREEETALLKLHRY
jgi:hypothetical protein